MDMIVTTAGRQALINAAQTGTAPVTISHIGVGTGKYTATEGQTGLIAETKRLPIIEGGSAGDSYIHVAYQDASEDAYSVNEIGLFLDDGTLFAVTSQATAILQKTATATALLVIDIAFTDVDVSALSFGDVTYSNPGATTSNSGVVTLATPEEVAAGTNASKAVTPATLLSRTATADRAGLVELATAAETTAGTDDSRAVTPAGAKASLDARAASSAEALAGLSGVKFVTPSSLRAVKASTALAGLVELATEAEVTAGTDDSRAVTPLRLRGAIEAALQRAAMPSNYLTNGGAISTSDEREKRDISAVSDAVLDAWQDVDFYQYRFKSGDRLHVGVIAQRVAEAFAAHGLDARNYGLFCEDTDEAGNVRYGIRYAEALAMECALQRRETERLRARLDALEGGKA